MTDAIQLTHSSGDGAEILAFGAELSSWRARGVDMIWAKNPKVWDQTAPVLFPVVGWTRDGRVRVEALIQRLALLIAKAAVAAPHAEERGDE